jgi:hypothetical protein
LTALVSAGEDPAPLRVGLAAGLRVDAFYALEDEHFDPDLRAGRDRIITLAARRALALVSDAAREYAHDVNHDPRESIPRLRIALDEVLA